MFSSYFSRFRSSSLYYALEKQKSHGNFSLPWDEFALFRTFAVPPMFEKNSSFRTHLRR